MTESNFKGLFTVSSTRLFEFVEKALIAFSVLLLGLNLKKIIEGDGWANRSAFFLEGDLAPTLPDFVFNEMVLPFFLLYVVIVKVRPIVVIIFIASAFAYFNRSPIILIFCALIFSPNISVRQKTVLGAVLLTITFSVLYLRAGDVIFDLDVFSLFFLTYPFVGLGRLLESSVSADVNFYHVISILIKPIDAVFFVIDYLSGLKGSLSAARFVGAELTQFVYLPLLGDSYNAFGTLLYPFIVIFGWYFGSMFFFLFIITTYYAYRIHFRQHAVALRILSLLLLTGLLFSWSSPFIWIIPFVFPRSLLRRHPPIQSFNKL